MTESETTNDTPEVQCSGCHRRVACMVMTDGTIYRPFAWTFLDEKKPLVGTCQNCSQNKEPTL